MTWSRLEMPWRRRLGSIKCFHATDCAAHDGEFAAIKKEDCAPLSNDLASIIAAQGDDLMAVGHSVYRDDWDYGASSIIKRQFRTQYHFCMSMVLLQINQISQDFARGDPVAFVFAKQRQYQEYAQTIHEVFQQGNMYSGIGHLGFGEPKCIVPLQAADLFAYETYRELLAQSDDPVPPRREQLSTIHKGIGVRSTFSGLDFFHPTSDGFEKLFSPTAERGEDEPPSA
jgi:hypothetical protein